VPPLLLPLSADTGQRPRTQQAPDLEVGGFAVAAPSRAATAADAGGGSLLVACVLLVRVADDVLRLLEPVRLVGPVGRVGDTPTALSATPFEGRLGRERRGVVPGLGLPT
jgi:hypothetical protein